MRLFYVSKSSTGLLQFSKNATVVTTSYSCIRKHCSEIFLTYNLSASRCSFKNNGGRILLSLMSK